MFSVFAFCCFFAFFSGFNLAFKMPKDCAYCGKVLKRIKNDFKGRNMHLACAKLYFDDSYDYHQWLDGEYVGEIIPHQLDPDDIPEEFPIYEMEVDNAVIVQVASNDEEPKEGPKEETKEETKADELIEQIDKLALTD